MESPIGQVPDVWRAERLGDVCDVQAGFSRRRFRDEGGVGVPIVMPRNIVGRRISVDPEFTRAPPGDAGWPARYRLEPDDLVCVRTGDLGRSALVREENAGWFLGGGCLRLRVRDDALHPRYLLYYLDHPAVTGWIQRSSTGSAIPTLSVAVLRQLQVVFPAPVEQDGIVAVLAALDEKIAVHTEILRTTADLRESLQKLLLSGLRPTR